MGICIYFFLLVHLSQYVATLRELLEQLAKERNPDGLPRISKAKVNEYAENIEVVAAKLAVPTSDVHTPKEPEGEISSSGTPKAEGSVNSASEGLRRRFGYLHGSFFIYSHCNVSFYIYLS
ncbi:hypothetical protein AABB24_023671 [Solanum stoloniferum]|uniref:Uncharacterized protein n=1 Tax=Solanum stoloniferum TaxID=62892 RepID=A0ABD2SKD9_9SOLN